MTRPLLALSFGFAALIAATQIARGEAARCGDHAAITAHLAEHYGEARRAIALAADNSLVEIFVSQTGSWTMLVTRAGGPTCMIASGQNFEALREDPPASGRAL